MNPQQDLLSQSWTLPDQDKPESDEGGMWVAVLNFEGVTVRKACADADYLETPFYQWVTLSMHIILSMSVRLKWLQNLRQRISHLL